MFTYDPIYEDYEYESYEHKKVCERIEESGDWYDEVIDLLYGNKKFDIDTFENALYQLGECLERKISPKLMGVDLNEWVTRNNNYLKSL